MNTRNVNYFGAPESGTSVRCPVTHDAEKVSVGRADVNLRLDKGLPLFDEGAELVAGEVHSVEVGQHGGTLDILATKLYLPVSL